VGADSRDGGRKTFIDFFTACAERIPTALDTSRSRTFSRKHTKLGGITAQEGVEIWRRKKEAEAVILAHTYPHTPSPIPTFMRRLSVAGAATVINIISFVYGTFFPIS
jgi:hypothetical protein